MARRLYYQDSYGRVHRARSAGHTAGALPASLFTRTLMLLALVVVLACLVH